MIYIVSDVNSFKKKRDMRHSVLIYDSMAKAVRTMDDEDRLMVYDAIIDYGIFDKEDITQMSEDALRVWTLIRPILTATITRYERNIERQRK